MPVTVWMGLGDLVAILNTNGDSGCVWFVMTVNCVSVQANPKHEEQMV